MSVRLLSSLTLLVTTVLGAPDTQQKSSCAACDPQGIKTLNTPAFGPDLGPMYNDLVNSVQGIHFLGLDGLEVLDRRSAAEIEGRRRLGKRDPPPLCCELGRVSLAPGNVLMRWNRRFEHAVSSHGRASHAILLRKLPARRRRSDLTRARINSRPTTTSRTALTAHSTAASTTARAAD